MDCIEKMKSDSSISEQKEQHPGISMWIVQSISTLWQSRDLEDFKVTVEGDIYSCHSFILASCSEFFRALLRSNMKEKQEMKVQLSNISSPIFQLILKTLYTGIDLLTTNNVLEVWSAVHQLQIQFLIKHCEDFIMSNLSLDNLEMYKDHADYLHSQKVGEHIINFILKHFSIIKDKELFLRFDFQYLIKLFQSDKLEVTSEDEVLYSIFDWVKYGNKLTPKMDARKDVTANKPTAVFSNTLNGLNSNQNHIDPNRETLDLNLNNHYISTEQQLDSINPEGPNERKKYLSQLLSETRYYLASESCIFSLYKNKLIQSDMLVKESLLEAYTFKFCNNWHNFRPTKAIHRDRCEIEHVGVCCEEGYISAFSFKRRKWFYIKCFPRTLNGKVIIFNGKLYGCSMDGTSNSLFVLTQENKWVSETEISHAVEMLLAHGNFIYMLNTYGQLSQFNPQASQKMVETHTHTINNIAHALVYNNNIVVFSSVNNQGVEETAVHSWNTETQAWTKFDNLQLCSENMTSFCNDRDTYILECNGNVWKLTNANSFRFTVVAKLWNEKYVIKGALLFRESLFIFGHFPNDEDEDAELGVVEGVFTSASFWKVALTSSNLAHHVTPSDNIQRYGS